MQRRDFLTKIGATAAVAMPFSTGLIESANANAQDCNGWIDVPNTNGKIQIKPLFHAGTADCSLFKLAANFPTRAHSHPQGEYSYIVQGSFSFASTVYTAGQYTYMEPGSSHPSGSAGSQGVVILVFVPAPVVY